MVPDNSRAQLPDPSSQGTRMKHLGPFPLFLRTKTHLLEGSSWQMGVTDPVILSPNPGSRSPFPSGLQPKSAVKTEVGKLFSHPPGLRWAGWKPARVLWRQFSPQDRPLRGHKWNPMQHERWQRWPSADLTEPTPPWNQRKGIELSLFSLLWPSG